MSTGTCPHWRNTKWSKHVKKLMNRMIHHNFVDWIPQLFLAITPLNIHILLRRLEGLICFCWWREDGKGSDSGIIPLEDLIYCGKGKWEWMMDINIKDLVELKTASVWQRQKHQLLITNGARIASRLFKRVTADLLLYTCTQLFSLQKNGSLLAIYVIWTSCEF